MTRPPVQKSEYLRLFDRLDRTAALLDSRFRVPYTRVRFGWDAIIGLLPVVGDLATAAVSLHLVRCAHTLEDSDIREMVDQRVRVAGVAELGRKGQVRLLWVDDVEILT